MKQFLIWATVFTCLCCNYGCKKVANPREGGLFGYSPELYEQRIQEREDKLTKLNNENEAEQARSQSLEGSVAASKTEVERLQKDLNKVNAELMATKTSLKKMELKSPEAEKKRNELEGELKSLGRQSWQTGKQLEQGSVEGKKEEIKQLRAKLDQLMEEAEMLSDL